MLRLYVRGIACAITTLACPMAATAQTAAAATFEVASVKPNTRLDGPRGIVVDPGRFTATGVALADLIRYAYAFNSLASQSQVIGGPSWIATARFDIVATAAGQPTLGMLKALLEDRFKVMAHIESREAAVYALLVDRSDRRLGPAIHPSTSACFRPSVWRDIVHQRDALVEEVTSSHLQLSAHPVVREPLPFEAGDELASTA